MNLKVLFALLGYYGLISAIFILGSGYLGTATTNANLSNMSGAISGSETDLGGLFGSGVSFSRFFLFVAFGIIFDSGSPAWFLIIFAIWQTLMTIFSVGFVVSSIWNG